MSYQDVLMMKGGITGVSSCPTGVTGVHTPAGTSIGSKSGRHTTSLDLANGLWKRVWHCICKNIKQGMSLSNADIVKLV
jgi:hypothetical protein